MKKNYIFKILVCQLTIIFLCISSAISSSLENSTQKSHITCKKGNIVILGDSFFTTMKDRQGSLESMFQNRFPDFCISNLANGGARFFGFGKNKINMQKSNIKNDILIIGGGANDFITCGKNKKCMNKFLNNILSKDYKKGKLIDVIKKHSKVNAKVFIVYPSQITENAPDGFRNVVKFIGQEYAKRMKGLAVKNPNVVWVDASMFINPKKKSHWLEDGYHPSVLGNKRLTIMIKKLYNSDKNILLQKFDEGKYVPQYTCAYSFTKFGFNDNKVPYNYVQVLGLLSVLHNSKLEEKAIIFNEENWKIKNADKYFFRENANYAFTLQSNGKLFGQIQIYSNSKSRSITSISSDYYSFKSDKNNKFKTEGLHIFKQVKNKNEYHFNINKCN